MAGSLALSGSDGSSLSFAFLLAAGDEGSSLALRLPSGARIVGQSIAQVPFDALCGGSINLLSSFTIVKASGADAGYRNALRGLRHDFREREPHADA